MVQALAEVRGIDLDFIYPALKESFIESVLSEYASEVGRNEVLIVKGDSSTFYEHDEMWDINSSLFDFVYSVLAEEYHANPDDTEGTIDEFVDGMVQDDFYGLEYSLIRDARKILDYHNMFYIIWKEIETDIGGYEVLDKVSYLKNQPLQGVW